MKSVVLTGSLMLLVAIVMWAGMAYADSGPSRVILTEHTTVIVQITDQKAHFQEAFVGQYEIVAEDISRDRPSTDSGRVFGTTTTGEKVYIIYDLDTGKVSAKIWGDGFTLRSVSHGKVLPLF